MSDMVVNSSVARAAQTEDRTRTLNDFKSADALFHSLTFGASVLVLLVMGGIILSLIIAAWPAMVAFGVGFFETTRWAVHAKPHPVMGVLAPLYGTMVTSVIAMLIAVPVGLGIAVFLTELCPLWLRRPISTAIELLAGIPSIIYGMWGMFYLAPFLATSVEPSIVAVFSHIPLLNVVFAEPISNQNLFNAGFVLAIMILPFITAVSCDVFATVPPVLKEAAYGIGCTTWEVMRNVVIPYTRVGLIGGVMLALGRALGETMAVTFIVGNESKVTGSIFSAGVTISSLIANEFAESDGLHQSALLYSGLILFVLVFFVLTAARYMLARGERKLGA